MINAMILAAGRSRRMGVQKLLLPLGDKPVIAHIVDELLSSSVDRIFVIVGPDSDQIAKALTGRRVEFVTNPDAEAEMLSSVRCGLKAMPEDCAAMLVVLGDQPGITTDVVAALLKAYQTSGRGIVIPTYNGQRGHPLVIAMHYRNEILNCYEDVGLRGLLHAHSDDVYELELSVPNVVEDMDVPEDYQRAVTAFLNRSKDASDR